MRLSILFVAMFFGSAPKIFNWQLGQNPQTKKKLFDFMRSKKSFKCCLYVDLDTFYPEMLGEDFFEENLCPLLTMTTSRAMKTSSDNASVSPSHAFIFLNSYEDTTDKISFLFNTGIYKATLPTVLFFKDPVINQDFPSRVSEKLVRYYIFFSMLVFYHDEVKDLSYNPIDNRFHTVSEFEEFVESSLQSSNLQSFKLRAAIFVNPPRMTKDHTGTWHSDDEPFWVSLISELNGTLELVETTPYDLDAAKLAVRNGQADFCPLSWFRTSIPENLDFTAPYTIEKLVVLVPTPDVLHKSLYMFMTFSKNIWIHLLFTMVCIAVFFIVTEKISVPKKKGTTPIILDLICILCGKPIRIYQDYSWLKKSLLCLFQMNIIILVAAFQSFMITSMLLVRYRNPMDTLNQLADSKLTIYALPDIKRYIEEFSPRFEQQLVKIPRRKYSNLLNNQIYGQTLVTTGTVASKILELLNANGSEMRYRIMKEPIMSGFTTYFFTKNSMFVKRIDNLILRKYQYGLNSKPLVYVWQSKMPERKELQKKYYRPLQLSYMGFSIGLWSVGIVSSIIVFMLEKVQFSNV